MKNTLLEEYEIMLNPSLGAYALHSFVKEFTAKAQNDSKITLWHIMTILPLVYHHISRRAILKKRSLRTILNRDPDLDISQNEVIFNLNHRIKEMSPRTFRSLNLALHFKLLDICEGYFFPIGRHAIPKNAGEETQKIIKAAAKLGGWAAESSVFEYLTILGVKPQ
jgi:hypothetical protein